MLKTEFDPYVFKAYLEGQIKLLTEKINDDKHAPGDPNDDVSRGKLLVCVALDKSVKALNKRVEEEKLTPQELGVMGAINDILQNLGLVEPKTTLAALIGKLP
jgi:hypothetical protein